MQFKIQNFICYNIKSPVFVKVKPSLSNIVRGDFIVCDVLSLSHVTVTRVMLLYKCHPY